MKMSGSISRFHLADQTANFFSRLLVVLVVAWVADLPRLIFGTALLTQEFTLVVLGLCLAISYLSCDAPSALRVRVNTVLAILSLGATLVAAARYRILSEEMFYHPEEAFLLGGLIVPLVLVALYRQAGWALTIIVLTFVAYGLFGDKFPDPFTARPWLLPDLLPHLALDTTAMVGVPLTIGITVVVPFILFGAMLFVHGGGEFFTDLAIALMGKYRGGAAKIAVVSSALFGTISGSAVSNVASTGVISIPMMKQAGLKGRIAAATEAVASTGGQFMPPVMGAAAFLMSELARIPYSTIAIAAVLPALFFFFAVFMQSDADAVRFDVKPIPKAERLPIRQIMRDGWHFLLPFVVMISMMFVYDQSPAFSALSAAGVILILGQVRGYKSGRLAFNSILMGLTKAGRSSVEIIVIVAAAGFVIGVLNATGLVFNLTLIIVDLADGSMVALLILAALTSIVLGMGMPTMAVYVLLAALVVPALIESGVPVLSAHMFVLYFGMMSMITPPIAIASFAASTIAEERPLQVAFTSMRYAWIAYLVPFIFVFRTDFLIGSSGQTLLGTADLFWGTFLLVMFANAAFTGVFHSTIEWFGRVLCFAVSVGLFFTIIGEPSYEPLVYLILSLVLVVTYIWSRRAQGLV